jgi:16S rRNA (guanine(966)-N(2))-methyltransferase RsmD
VKNTRRKGLRPTSSFVLTALMNILGDIRGLTFIDLFAGTGRVGIEAEKRGADVIFVEKDPRRVLEIKKRARGKVVRADALSFLKRYGQKANIIFADPPYSFGDYGRLISLCLERLEEGGIFILEHEKKRDFNAEEKREYGDTALSFWRK